MVLFSSPDWRTTTSIKISPRFSRNWTPGSWSTCSNPNSRRASLVQFLSQVMATVLVLAPSSDVWSRKARLPCLAWFLKPHILFLVNALPCLAWCQRLKTFQAQLLSVNFCEIQTSSDFRHSLYLFE